MPSSRPPPPGAVSGSQPPPSPDADRRREQRHLSCFPAHITLEETMRSALIHDASATGVQLLTRTKLEVGQHVRLRLYILEDVEKPREVTGRVVRFEVRPPDLPTWPFAVGVQFDEPLTDCAEEIKLIAERQARLYTSDPPPENAP